MHFGLSYGDGGWCRVFGDQLPDLYVRLTPTEGAWRVTELYAEGRDRALTGEMLRTLPLAAIEHVANAESSNIEERFGLLSIQMSVLASHYNTGGVMKLGGWVSDMFQSQIKGSGVPAAPRKVHRYEREQQEVSPLRAPENGLTDEFLAHVAKAYLQAIRNGQSPAKQLAREVGPGTSDRTVHRWIYTARKRGILDPPSRRGRVT